MKKTEKLITSQKERMSDFNSCKLKGYYYIIEAHLIHFKLEFQDFFLLLLPVDCCVFNVRK